ncbi:MAG: hypothetical protein ACE10D_08185, partial [Planctomycetota bacterium]
TFEEARAALDAVKMEELLRDLKRTKAQVQRDLERLQRDLAALKAIVDTEEAKRAEKDAR